LGRGLICFTLYFITILNNFTDEIFTSNIKLNLQHGKIHINNAYRALKEEYPNLNFDIFCLNSETKIQPFLSGLYESDFETDKLYIGVYDNDEAGDRATKQLFDAGLPVKDMRACYAPYKDINEYLILEEQRKKILTPRKRGLCR